MLLCYNNYHNKHNNYAAIMMLLLLAGDIEISQKIHISNLYLITPFPVIIKLLIHASIENEVTSLSMHASIV